MKSFSIGLLSFVILASLLGGPVYADTIREARDRMEERLVQIDQMKSEGTVGENARGFLSIRTSLGPAQTTLVEAENADRRAIYRSVAESTGQRVEEVGRQRASRIFKLARSGVWLLGLDGQWLRKP